MRLRNLFVMAAVCVSTAIAVAGQEGTAAPQSEILPAGAINAAGSVPRLIRFSGFSRDSSGKPTNGLVTMTFSVYAQQSGGAPLWSEPQKVQVDAQGNYSALLGATTTAGLPQDLFSSGQALWLGVQPQLPAAGELPRVLLVAVPYALKSVDADSLGGKPASSYVTVDSLNLMTATSLVTLGSQTANSGRVSSASNPVTLSTASPNIIAHPATACTTVTSDGTATANYLAKFTAACNVQKSLLYDNGTKIGVGTMAPLAVFDVFPPPLTGTVVSQYGMRHYTQLNPAANNTGLSYAAYANAQTLAGNAFNFSQIYGMGYEADHVGTGTVSYLIGASGAVANKAAGNVSNATGVQTSVLNLGSGTITNAYGLKIGPLQNTGGGSVGSYYGVFITAPPAAPTNYALYSAGGTNYFGGKVGIGTTAPGANLEVNGTVKINSTLTVTSLAGGRCVQTGTAGVLTVAASACGSAGGERSRG